MAIALYATLNANEGASEVRNAVINLHIISIYENRISSCLIGFPDY